MPQWISAGLVAEMAVFQKLPKGYFSLVLKIGVSVY